MAAMMVGRRAVQSTSGLGNGNSGQTLHDDEGLAAYGIKWQDAVDNPVHEISKPTAEREEAAIQIQAAYRGMYARNSQSRLSVATRQMQRGQVDTSLIFQHLSNSTELQNLEKHSSWSIAPDRTERVAWDVFILVLVIYSSIQGPFTIAFLPFASMDLGDWFVDLCFYADIVLNFFTGYDQGFEVVMSRKEIVQHYLQGWFIIDLVATVEWDLLYAVAIDSEGSNLISLVRLLKILRMARTSRLISRITAGWTIHTAFITASIFLLYVALICHLLACFFFLLPDILECPQDNSALPLQIPGNVPSGSLEAWWRVGDPDGPSRHDVLELASGVGWYKHGACLQGSWRQVYNLEEVCEVRDQRGVYHLEPWTDDELNVLKNCYVTLATSKSHKMQLADGTALDVSEVCRPCMGPYRLHIDAIYWSLTTMTTIGYGDRGPSTQSEIVFVLFAEVFGLCIFCLLLQQINRLGDVVGEESQQVDNEKNGVVGFLKQELGSENTLIQDAVRFLNFRASSLSGHSFHEHDAKFSMLSPGIIRAIQIAVYRPVLSRVQFFGWNEEDEKEEAALQDLFSRIDVSNDGTITIDEAEMIFKGMEIALTKEQLGQVFAEMDKNAGGDVNFNEFKHWWFLKKTGKPRVDRCPSEFLDDMCTKLHTQPFANNERMVHPGDYGKALVMILSGRVEIQRDRSGLTPLGPDGVDRETAKNMITAEDRDPVFGFASCLNHTQWEHIVNCSSEWTVTARSYVDTAWVHRHDIIRCFAEHWPDGQSAMEEISYAHYEIAKPPEGLGASALEQTKAELRAELPAEAPAWAKQMNNMLMRRMECIEKHMEHLVSQIDSMPTIPEQSQ